MTVDELIAEIEDGVADAMADNPGVGSEDAAHDITLSMFFQYSQTNPRTCAVVARCYLGWDPEEDADLYHKHNLDPDHAWG